MIPIFSKLGSNQAFAQDLDFQGKIRQFLPIASDRYPTCGWLPPAICLDVGDAGVLAYVDENGVGQLMAVIHMKEYLAQQDASDPLERLEIASLLGEKEMLREAIKDCRESFPILDKKGWSQREEAIFDMKKKLSERRSPETKNYEQHEREFHEIEGNLDHEKWVPMWLRLWQQDFSKDRLIGLASYVVDARVKCPKEFSQVYASILRLKRDQSVIDRALKLIADYPDIDRGIVDLSHVFNYFLSDDNRRRANQSFLRMLASESDLRPSAPRLWVQLWSNCIRYTQDLRPLAEIARSYLSHRKVVSPYTAERIFTPLWYDDDLFVIVYEDAVRWLQSQLRSSILWARTFLAAARVQFTPELASLGEEWLKYHGGNTKIWVSVWNLFSGDSDRLKFNSIAINWLARARWDMRAWVDVYVILANDPERPTEELISLGQNWLNSGYGNTSSRRRIVQALNYLRTR